MSYTGVTQKANVAALQSDLDNASKKLKMYYALYSSYPTALNASYCPTAPTADTNYCLPISSGNAVSYNGSINAFSLVETNSSNSTYYKITNDSAPTVASSLDSGLVAYYTFNNDTGTTIVDSSGNGFSGTAQNGVSHVSDNMGQAIYLNGTNQYATIPRAWSFANNLQGAYSFWFKSSCSYASNLLMFDPGTTRLDTNFETGSKNIFVFNYDSTGTNNLVWKSPDASYMNGNWHHIIVNKTATRADVYMDGVSVGGLNTNLKTNADASSGQIGTGNYIGSFDDVRIYNRSLTTGEIQTLYSQATP